MFFREDEDRAPAIAPKEKLADTLSGLLRQAVRDCQLVEKMPGYVLNMGVWHEELRGACHVCMAGAVMACTVGASRTERVFDVAKRTPGIQHRLEAINMMRGSSFASAYRDLYGSEPNEELRPKLWEISGIFAGHWMTERARFPWGLYEQAADKLEALGL